MHQAETAAFLNQKGGVGKTTSVVNVGAGLSILGKKVLIVDLDPQGHLTSFLGIGSDEIDWTGANNDTWQLLRTSVTGLQDNREQWITFESWYPARLGGQVIDRNWMVWELSLIHISEPTRLLRRSRMPSTA